MKVEYSGWTRETGPFRVFVFVDETKTDYEIHYASGKVLKQNSPFDEYTYDWNNDGDIYPQTGAFFSLYNQNGEFERKGVFMSPTDMVRALVDGKDEYHRKYDDVVVSIPGIEIPEIKKHRLEDEILRSERRAMAQEVERNRKMNAFGIRPPGEPWAK